MFKKIVILFFILSLFFISCKRDEIKTDSTQDYILNISDANIDEKIYETKQNWHITNKKVLVLIESNSLLHAKKNKTPTQIVIARYIIFSKSL